METTGLEKDDKIVSLAMILLHTSALAAARYELQLNHWIFNPGRPSHPDARRVHGYTDTLLARQESFAEALPQIHELLQAADLIVAHNAEFDLGFLNKELAACDLPCVIAPSFCTLNAWRDIGLSPARLSAAAAVIGLRRANSTHNAIEDAWLALMIYLFLHDRGALVQEFDRLGVDITPRNLRGTMAPETERMLHELRIACTQALRDRRHHDSEALLQRLADEAERAGDAFTPVDGWAFEKLAIAYRRKKEIDSEIAILRRYLALPAARAIDAGRIRERLAKAEARRHK